MLIEVSSQESGDNDDKTMDYLGKQLTEAWQRTIERSELRYHDFYAPRDFDTAPDGTQAARREEAKAIVSDEVYIDADYSQPPSTYLSGLPEGAIVKNTKLQALRILFWWEKHIIPGTIDFVRNNFQPWEIRMTFEQIRHYLKLGEQ